jgi:hypothetical protein
MSNGYSFDRVEFVSALKEWCGDRFNPLVGFPGLRGYPNVAYLYDKNYLDLIESSTTLMQFLQKKLGVPVVVFVEPLNRKQGTALSCDEWLAQAMRPNLK